MNKKLIKLASFAAVLSCLLISCGHEPTAKPLYPFEVSELEPSNKPVYKPADSTDTILWDDFEGETLTSKINYASQGAELISLGELRSQFVNEHKDNEYLKDLFDGRNSKAVKIDADHSGKTYLKINNLSQFTNYSSAEENYLTFRYTLIAVPNSEDKTINNPEPVFKVYADDKVVYSEVPVNSITCFSMKLKSVKIPAGTNSITFEVNKQTRYAWENWPNGLFLDDISLVKNKVSSVFVSPRSVQKTYIDCPAGERIKVNAYATRADGTIIEGQTFSFSCSNGNVDSNGYFKATSTGTTKIRATCNGKSGESGEITIFANQFAEGSCSIGGVTYYGTQSDNGDILTKFDPHYSDYDGKIVFEYPSTNYVSADGYFRLKGKVIPSTKSYSDYSKLCVFVQNNKNNEYTVYYADGEFDIRIWLPFGGEHTVDVCAAKFTSNSYVDSKGNQCEGDIISYNYIRFYQITAINTHPHSVSEAGSNDGRYIYPSYVSQSDNYLIQNITNEALYGLPENAPQELKFQAIHDYIVLNYYYDNSSISTAGNKRKKQDAVSVVENGMAVCAGYTALTSAMARCAGIPSKYISSEGLNHAWNHVRINGTWYFCDTTWDDPIADVPSDVLLHDYFLITDYNGIRNDHKYDQTVLPGRVILPQQIIEPELPLLIREGYIF